MTERSTDPRVQPVFTEDELRVSWGGKVIKGDRKTGRVLHLYQALGGHLVIGIQGRGLSKRIYVPCKDRTQVNTLARSLLNAWCC